MDKAKAMILEMREKSFDQAYANNQVSAHEQAIKLYKEEAENGKDPELKAFAKATLPTLEKHLEHAKNSLLRMAVMLPRSKSSAPHDGIYTL